MILTLAVQSISCEARGHLTEPPIFRSFLLTCHSELKALFYFLAEQKLLPGAYTNGFVSSIVQDFARFLRFAPQRGIASVALRQACL